MTIWIRFELISRLRMLVLYFFLKWYGLQFYLLVILLYCGGIHVCLSELSTTSYLGLLDVMLVTLVVSP